ncbi:MAG TPA: ATP-binding protein [Ktedonobacteraceae bacterium]|nr:ATP-binding protein [Ktedonobacteraceae bacterium]
MQYMSWIRIRAGRLLAIVATLGVYFLLLTMDGLGFFAQNSVNASSLLQSWARFGFSAFLGLIFLAVGALVWLYARNRYVALPLFCFSFTMMVVFVSETGAALNDPLLSAINNASGPLALSVFSVLLLLFPTNYLALSSSPDGKPKAGQQRLSTRLLRGYVVVILLLSIVTASSEVLFDLRLSGLPAWLHTMEYSYYLLVLTGILVTIIVPYRQSSLRQRQQLRIFVFGVILAFAPFLLLTLLPLLLRLSGQYVVDAQISTLTAILLPLGLGYTILRYQILVFDMYIRRAVAWMAGSVSLAIVGYLVVMLCSLFLSNNTSAYIISVAAALVILGPCIWWLAHVITERLFFNEMAHYRRLVNNPDLLNRETFNLGEASELLTMAVVNTFETQDVCLFVLDEDTGCYHISPTLNEDDPDDSLRGQLVRLLLQTANATAQGDAAFAALENGDWLGADAALIRHVENARRPLLLSEAAKSDAEQPTGLARFLSTSVSEDADPLLAAVRSQGKMIGLLVLGERGDRQQYAGPDFEAIHLIVGQYSAVLETARLYQHASRHVATLNTLYSAHAMLEKAYSSIEEVAQAYATVAAEAVGASIETWLLDPITGTLRCLIHQGPDVRLSAQESITSLQEDDWSPYFYDRGGTSKLSKHTSTELPPCLSQAPLLPFAWLPLSKGEQQFGILMLTYIRPHVFSHEEKRVLSMFASQCAAAMENAQITIELRAAYERQKELDHLKDQFIMTASHELRTPLTAVQGYIELLEQYNETLPVHTRAEFIAKAHRGCDELTLMVGNIMDASRVQVDVEQIRLSPVSLANSVQHILEILDGVLRRENRSVTVDIAADIQVMADDLRLRQVLLNLVSNAIKYSPVGTAIDIAGNAGNEMVTVRVRDYGLGVPSNQQERLFGRFVRLERDMNSPVRGAGLGLYISRQLIEAMGGRIWLESRGVQGEGTTFFFTLRAAPVAINSHADYHVLSGGTLQ